MRSLPKRLSCNSCYLARQKKGHLRKIPGGFVLLLVVLMIGLCSIVASHIATQTMLLVNRANEAQRDAQRRWAVVSIRRTLLGQAPMILANSPELPSSTARSAVFQVPLNRELYNLELWDESAKLPMARLLLEVPTETAKITIRRLARYPGRLKSSFPSEPVFFTDCFVQPHSDDTLSRFRDWREQTTRLSLWTDGRLNIQNAEKETVDALWFSHFSRSAPQCLVKVRELPTDIDFLAFLRSQDLKESEMKFATEWFTRQSTTYSLWIQSGFLPTDSGKPFTAVYVRRQIPGMAEDNFGVHYP